jgi:hypothetical protein
MEFRYWTRLRVAAFYCPNQETFKNHSHGTETSAGDQSPKRCQEKQIYRLPAGKWLYDLVSGLIKQKGCKVSIATFLFDIIPVCNSKVNER